MALLPRRFALAAVLAIGVAGLQPLLAGEAVAATSLATPGSLAPNSSTIEQKDPVLSWSAVAGASSYQVELSKSDDWSNVEDMVPLDNNVVSVTSFAVPQTLVHGVYFWRVRATDSSDKGSWSANAQFDRAWDDAPSTAGSTPSSDTTATQSGIASYPWRFAWTALPDASSYEVELSTQSTFPQPGTVQSGKLIDGSTTVECLTQATSFTPYTNAPATPDLNVDTCDLSQFNSGAATVFWRVRGIDDSATKALSPTNEPNPLICYGVETDPDNPPSQTSTLALGTPTSVGQECSDWSSVQSVAPASGAATAASPGTVTGLALNCPTGTGSDYACAATPEFSWQPVVHAAQYAVTIADDKSFTNVERTYVTPFLSLTPRDELADYTAGKGYYVAVQACSSDSVCGTSTVATFTKQTPALTGLSAVKVPGGVRLVWNDLAGRYDETSAGLPAVEAEDYVVSYTDASDTGFDNATSVVVDAACDSKVDTCYSPGGNAGQDQTIISPATTGSYIWQVSPVDLSGNVLPATTDTTAISVDLTPPSFRITTHSGVSVSGPLTITASEPVSGVSASSVHINLKGATASVAGKLSASGQPNTWLFSPTSPLTTGATYVLSLSSAIHDLSGNLGVVAGAGVRTSTTAANTSKAWTFSSGWKKHNASGALSGSYRAASAGKTAHLRVVGTSAELIGCKSPSMGSITVTVDGHSQTVSEHQSFTRCGLEIWHHALVAGAQTITVKVHKGVGDIDEVKVA